MTSATAPACGWKPPIRSILNYPNSDDGDRDFDGADRCRTGSIWLSVLDVTGDTAGLQFSLEAWYDSVYQTHTGNNSPATYTPVSVPNTAFAQAVKNLDGHYVDIGDSFVYANFHLGGMPLSLRVGRQTLVVGREPRFFPGQWHRRRAGAGGLYQEQRVRRRAIPKDACSSGEPAFADLQLAGPACRWRPITSSRAAPRAFPASAAISAPATSWGRAPSAPFYPRATFLLHAQDRATTRRRAVRRRALRKTIDDVDLGLYALRYNAKYPVTLPPIR